MTKKLHNIETISGQGSSLLAEIQSDLQLQLFQGDLPLQLLERDLKTYLDLHDVFSPETNENPPALSSITRELRERLTDIVRLSASQTAKSTADVVKKLEIFAIAHGNEAAKLAKFETDRLLRSAIDDLKALETPPE